MSEPLAKQRYTPGDAREPRIGSSNSGYDDPLAELARLVGRDDPFRDIFPARPRTNDAAEGHQADPPHPDAGAGFGHDEHHYDSEADQPHHGYAAPEPSAHDQFHTEEPRDDLRFPALPAAQEPFPDRQYGYDEPAVLHEAAGAAPHDAPELQADLWADTVQDDPRSGMNDYVPAADLEPAAEERSSSRRTLIVLAAVIALTGGGLGATFLVRGGSHSTTNADGTPTIMADTSPTKVQPPETANPSTGGDGTTALLEKSASDNVANAKVVNAQEQPIDLAQLPKSASAAAVPAATQQAGSPFPEPRKVKTVLIRPDGSVVGENIAPAQPSVAAGPTPGVVMPTAAAPEPAAPTPAANDAAVARASTPKSTVRASTTPKATTPHPAAKPKPVETATAETTDPTPAPTPVSTNAAGGFAVQLAAPPSEDEAKSISTRLQKKFADVLGGRKPGIHKADAGGKAVYRVRVGNLSQDGAKTLCSSIQSNGGSCFVVRN